MKLQFKPSPLMQESKANQAKLRQLLRENETKTRDNKKTAPDIERQINRPTMITTVCSSTHTLSAYQSKMKILRLLNQYLMLNPEFKQILEKPITIDHKKHPNVPAYRMKKIEQKLAKQQAQATPQHAEPAGPRTSFG